MSDVKKSVSATPQVILRKSNIKWKNETEFTHHLFKTEIANCLKNTSWKKDVVTIDQIPHVHHFHSCNSQGVDQKNTTVIAGHFHEVKMVASDSGELVATCGPALEIVSKKLPNGDSKKVTQAIKWHDGMTGKDVVDNHTHTLVYQNSEMITPKHIKVIQQNNVVSVDGFKEV